MKITPKILSDIEVALILVANGETAKITIDKVTVYTCGTIIRIDIKN